MEIYLSVVVPEQENNFIEVKPNLMQMPHNCSFICTDPKGEIP